MSFIGDVVDRAGHAAVTLSGATVSTGGVHFNSTAGSIHHVQVRTPAYASDATFTIAYWMTKEECIAFVRDGEYGVG